jgi:hypothetical protein
MPPVHWTWEISFGQAILTLPMALIAYWLFKTFKVLLLFRMEHEILMQDWALRQTPPVKLTDLYTRKRMWW